MIWDCLLVSCVVATSVIALFDHTKNRLRILALCTTLLLGSLSYVIIQSTPKSKKSSTHTFQYYKWDYPNKLVIPTIFFQGITESEIQVGRYLAHPIFQGATGEQVIANLDKYFPVIRTPWTSPELPEIKPHGSYNDNSFVQKLFDMAFHALTDSRREAVGILVHAPNKQELSLKKHSLHLEHVSLGGQGDIENHLAKYQECIRTLGPRPIIVYGVSRGAATSFSALCTYPETYTKVAGAVLESPYDSIPKVIEQRFALSYPLVNWLLSTYLPNYKPHGPFPISVIDSFPEQIPVLFITSAIDTSVPPERTKKLACALAARRKNTVYLLELQNSEHARYMLDNRQDAQTYRNVVHAFYRAHNLPHITPFAQAGKDQLLRARL